MSRPGTAAEILWKARFNADPFDTAMGLIAAGDDNLLARLHGVDVEGRRGFGNKGLDRCQDPECLICGLLACPKREPLHFHHDGCPVCGWPLPEPEEKRHRSIHSIQLTCRIEPGEPQSAEPQTKQDPRQSED